jgi:succinylglutamate desuccinylase
MSSRSIILRKGKFPGKTLAVFAGIHGNERVGILALRKIVKEAKINSGKVYFVFANPPAIKNGKRMIDKNLNRLFSRAINGDSLENSRAHQLMDILDECDALLDIHSYNSKKGNQFAISEPRGFEILRHMDFPIIASGFSGIGSGTDGYMERQKKIGICIECGTTNSYKKFLRFTEKSTYQFLQYFGCLDKKVEYSSVEQRYVCAKKTLIKKTSRFKFVKDFKDFEKLPSGKIFAIDGMTQYRAAKNQCILFPRPGVDIGGEVCTLCEEYE